ncbi:MAG TPA: universal stress protein [Bryobacteraceae bacterium]|nr:universal stress protein [Bryobacteraceae bacterium]
MPRFKHILFPVDFSKRCQAAKPFVASMVQRFNARLTLLHVINMPAGWYGGIDSPYPVMFDIPAMLKEGRKKLQEFFDAAPGTDITYSVEHGDPATLITSVSHTNDVDLIVMPTHGYGKFRILLLGSVAAKVLHDTRCAVWTAAHTEDPLQATHIDCRSMICAVDLDQEYVALIRYAEDLAKEYDAELRLVHAVTATEASSDVENDNETRTNLLESASQQIQALQAKAGTNLEIFVDGGPVSTVIETAALRYSADLVVIGRGKLHEKFGRLRTHEYSVIRDSPCPVLSV